MRGALCPCLGFRESLPVMVARCASFGAALTATFIFTAGSPLFAQSATPPSATRDIPELVTDRPDLTESSNVVGRGDADFQRRRIATTLTGYVSAYAATHPQEDFAETFRYFVTRRARMRELFAELGRKRKELVVYEKFLVLHDYVRSLRGWR